MEQPEANDAGGQRVPGVLHHSQAVVADPHPAQPFEPTDGSLDHPADLAQAASVFRLPLGNVRLDTQPGQQSPRGLAVVAPVGVQFVRQLLGTTRLPCHLGEIQYQRDDLSVVAPVGRSSVNGHPKPKPKSDASKPSGKGK